MDLRQINPNLAVSPQILPEDVPALADAGFKVLVNNRPDDEVGPEVDHEAMAKAAADAGMSYHYLPFQPGQITPDLISDFGTAIASGGPVVAYCRSGNRSTVLWALNQAGRMPAPEIVETAAGAGYDISGVAPLIESLASRKG
ncbi:TIGR01244 family sulfur transferase [Paracoccus sp. 1_MG-2023]|uniref:TIGR01244 family sulfur transferase n=1 Tax=unclassified Paracoccus (in: a-proteobacteria) TaxID=2688777 RepID=UPI001C095FCB|nr:MULTISPECIES: TIGR01244 family sulfur transferase [unclassified Paracoccus (in: a-proteobacteria)]MBU2958802.1 TIGR01244 family phosphatase [Paracoccus sp. C2R09]MDO6667795.1 TIGR01244 family sulfur transferase [Paracoccus sp. 1_MG-2023]